MRHDVNAQCGWTHPEILLCGRFRGSACFDSNAGCYLGKLLDIPDEVVYTALSPESLIANFELAVNEYLGFLKDLGGESFDHNGLIDRFLSVVVGPAA